MGYIHGPEAMINNARSKVDLPRFSHVLGNIHWLMAGSEPRFSGHLRVFVHGAELRAEMVAPNGREFFLRTLRRRRGILRRPEYVGYDEAAPGVEERKG